MEEKSRHSLDPRIHLMFGIMLAIHIVGTVSSVSILMAGTNPGLDVLEFDPPGLDETCSMLPWVFLLTLTSYVSYPRLQGRRWAKWILIFIVILNVICVIQLSRLWSQFL